MQKLSGVSALTDSLHAFGATECIKWISKASFGIPEIKLGIHLTGEDCFIDWYYMLLTDKFLNFSPHFDICSGVIDRN